MADGSPIVLTQSPFATPPKRGSGTSTDAPIELTESPFAARTRPTRGPTDKQRANMTSRDAQIAAQAVAAGVGDLALMAGDILNPIERAIAHGGVYLAEKAGFDPIDPELLVGAFPDTNAIREDAATLFEETTGIDLIDRENMTPEEQYLHNGIRFGTGGLTLGARAVKDAPRAYTAGRRLVRDFATGAGAGLADEAYTDHGSDAVTSVFGPVGDVVARLGSNIVGGVGGGAALTVPEAVVGNIANDILPDPNLPTVNDGKRLDPLTIARVVDAVQSLPDQDRLIADLEAHNSNPNAFPSTTAKITDNFDVSSQELAARTQNNGLFGQIDAERGAALANFANNNIAPSDWDATVTQEYMNALEQERVNDALVGAVNAEGILQDVKAAQQAQADELAALDAARPDTSRSLGDVFRAEYPVAVDEKNARFNQAPPGTEIDFGPTIAAADRLAANRAAVENAGASGFTRSRENLQIAADAPAAQSYQNAQALRGQIGTDLDNMNRGATPANFADRRDLTALKGVVDSQLDVVNPGAAAYFRDTFAPQYRDGTGGQLAGELDRNRGQFEDPYSAGDRLVRGHADAEQTLGPNASPEMRAAADAHLRSRLGQTGRSEVNVNQLQRQQNRDAVAHRLSPETAQFAQDHVTRAQDLAQRRTTAERGVRNAGRNVTDAERRQRDNPFNGTSPANAIAAVRRSGDPAAAMRELRSQLPPGDNTPELRGLQRAIIEDMLKEGETTRNLIGQRNLDGDATFALSRAGLIKRRKEYEAIMAEAGFTPEQMQAQTQLFRALESDGNLAANSAGGSHTRVLDATISGARSRVEKAGKGLLQAALMARYGMLKAGGIIASVDRARNAVVPEGDDIQRSVDEFYAHFFADPRLAEHLLKLDNTRYTDPKWNRELVQLLAAGAVARSANDENDAP